MDRSDLDERRDFDTAGMIQACTSPGLGKEAQGENVWWFLFMKYEVRPLGDGCWHPKMAANSK